MRITIHFMGQARLAAGCEQTTVDVAPGSSARAAVEAAVAQRGEALGAFLFQDGAPRRSVLLLVGQRQVSWNCETPLREDESVTLLPPIAGGDNP